MNDQSEVRYKMTTKERKQYFKEYYLKSKAKSAKPTTSGNPTTSGIVSQTKSGIPKKRGRPKKVIPKFKITRFDKPIVMVW